MNGRSISAILRKGWGFPAVGPPPTFCPFLVGLRTVMAAVGVSLSLLVGYSEHVLRLKV